MSKEEKKVKDKNVFEEKPLLEHIRELLIRLRRIIIYLISITAIYFFIGITYIDINGQQIPIPIPDLYNSLSVMIVRYLINTTVPQGLKLINIGFMDTLLSSLYVAFYFGLLTSLPLILREIWAFIAPGLYEHEKRLLRNIIIPSIILFALGSLFAYYIIVPLMLKFLYYYTLAFQVEPTLSIRSFISTIISLMIGTGLAFQLPLFMIILTMIGLVKAQTWRKYWRYGIFVGWLIAWVISPGIGGGLIESMIALILNSLYVAGIYFASYIERNKNKKKK